MSFALLMDTNDIINLKKNPLSRNPLNQGTTYRTTSVLTNGSSETDVSMPNTPSVASSFDEYKSDVTNITTDVTIEKDKLEIVSECEETENNEADIKKNLGSPERKFSHRQAALESCNRAISAPRNFRYAPLTRSTASGGNRGGRGYAPAAFFLKRRETCSELIVETVEEKEEEEEEENERGERSEKEAGRQQNAETNRQQQQQEKSCTQNSAVSKTTPASYVTSQSRHNQQQRSKLSSDQQQRLKSKRSRFRRTASSHGNHLPFRHPLLQRQQSQSAFSVTKLFSKGGNSETPFQKISESESRKKIGNFPAVVRCATAFSSQLSNQQAKKEPQQQKKTAGVVASSRKQQSQHQKQNQFKARQKNFKRSSSQYVSRNRNNIFYNLY